MKKSRYSTEQMAFPLRQAEGGTPVSGDLPQDGRERADVLSLEEAVRPATGSMTCESLGGSRQRDEVGSIGVAPDFMNLGALGYWSKHS